MQTLNLTNAMKKKLKGKADNAQLSVPEYIRVLIEKDLEDGFLEGFEEVYGFLYDDEANEKTVLETSSSTVSSDAVKG